MRKNIKNLLATILVIIMVVSVVFFVIACKLKSGNTTTKKTVNVYVPAGATVLSIAQMAKNNAQLEGYETKYTVVVGADKLKAAVTNGEADIFIAPTNVGSILHNKLAGQKEIKLIANEFNSLLYIVGRKDVETLEDLKGGTVYVIGAGATPDLTFQYILNKKKIEFNTSDEIMADKVNVKYVEEGTLAIKKLAEAAENSATFAIVGEPLATVGEKKGFKRNFSVNNLWNEVEESTEGFPQASLFAAGEILNDITFMNWFINESKSNSVWVKENPTEATEALEKAELFKFPVPLTAALLANINFEYKDATKVKNQVNSYLKVLFEMNKMTVGGKIPTDTFYYGIK